MKEPAQKLIIPDDVAEFVRRMHPYLKKKIKPSLKIILSDPDSGKMLRDELTGLRSFRVSSFRIIYSISTRKIIEIVAIGPRVRIYDETFRLLKKSKDTKG